MKRRGRRHGGRATQSVPPTPQTVQRLRHDVVESLYEKGKLRSEHLSAAEEIRRLWQAFSRCLGPSAVNYGAMDRPSRRKSGYQPIEWLTEREELIWRNRYRPWAREAAQLKCGGVLPVTRLQLVLAIVVENRGLRQVEGEYRMRHGAAVDTLRSGLHRYAEIGQWVRPDEKITVKDKNKSE